MTNCFRCEKQVAKEDIDFTYNEAGEPVCEECQAEVCQSCLHGEAEVETNDGRAICNHCAEDRTADLCDLFGESA